MSGPMSPIGHKCEVLECQLLRRSWGISRHICENVRRPPLTQLRHFCTRSAKRLHPGSLSQKQINLFGKPSSGGIVLQKEVISPGKRYETSTGDPGRHLTAHIDRDQQVVT